MKAKELLEARWKVITFLLLALLGSAGNILFSSLLPSATDEHMVPMFQSVAQEPLKDTFEALVWQSWFMMNGPAILGLFAILLGSGLIANEVNKGTLFFLLSKPISRDRLLLTKYGVSAGLLLIVGLMSALTVVLVCLLLGHAQNILNLLTATGLLWLGTLFPLGVSLCFSILSPDSLRPVIFTLLVVLALTLLPMSLPGGQNWSLWHYWGSQSAYITGHFPLKEYIVCFVVAVVPLLLALIVFRRKAY
uniref:ABC transporter permease n=1 Tax=Thermosporothrix sp. COM3 TaxID=2490863 RepID=A0A455SJR3_9CHLR|nr:hypothetical protein KTC_27270 [Thermosporothrix sp. COM3]